ncbi:MAG: polysaccharide biosynthesis tyrosine autokinase [Erysipelotrichaceae bacterium]|nr:polysaccharide biosynthesis tyrosine autokinase [Erysipelotrichaceae bacterium]
MSEKRDNNSELFENIEFFSLIMDVLKNSWAILLGALACAMITMMIFTARTTETYTSTATFAVMYKRTSSSVYAYNNLSSARSVATSFTSILNSDVLKKMVCEDIGLERFDARTSARVIDETNLLTLSVTSDSPEKTFRIIRSIMKLYPDLIQYVNTTMVMEVLAQPQVPLKSVNGHSPVGMAKRAFVLSFGLLTLAFAFLSYRHDTIKSEKDAREKLDATFLGSIEYEKLHKSKSDLGKSSVLVSDVTASFSFVEKYKKIAAAVLKSAERHHAKVIMISSVAEHEGKSTVAANLALTMQEQGKKVLLVDCDMRRPSQAKIFDIEVKEGTSLSDFLNGNRNAAKDIVYRDPLTRLPLILAGKGSRDSTEYLKEPVFRKLIEKLSELMDIIILDTPPMSLMADAEAVANIADISLLVVQYNRSLAEDINDAIDELKKYRCHMSGCILNGVRTLPGARRAIVGSYYGNYGRYGRYGGYGKYGKYGSYGNYGNYGHYGVYGHYAERKDPTASAKKKDDSKVKEENV